MQTMCPYVIACRTASGSVAERRTNGPMITVVTTATTAQLRAASTMPIPPARSARSGSRWAYLRAMYVFVPTPVPTAMATMMSCSG